MPKRYGGAEFGELPSAATRAKSYPRWNKMLKSHIYRVCVLEPVEVQGVEGDIESGRE